MKKLYIPLYVYIFVVLCFFSLFVKAQEKTNYILTETQISNSNKIQEYNFFDGLGREYLKASNGINGDGKFVYYYKDILGENLIKNNWLPTVDNKSISPMTHKDIYVKAEAQYSDISAFKEYEYDAAGHVKKKYNAGEKWKYHPASISYITNTANDVKEYPLIHPEKPTQLEASYYKAGTLSGICETDEDGIKITTYKDSYGRKILERRGDNNDTYFVYDFFDRLIYVLTPKYQENNDLDKYSYQYKYDMNGNMLSKKIPGCAPIEYLYDNCERCVSIQDGELKRRGYYRFQLYDNLGRLVIQGLSTTPPDNSKSGIVKHIVGSKGIEGSDYSLIDGSNYNLSECELEIVNYYDDYSFLEGTCKSLFQGIELPKTNYAKERLAASIVWASNGEKIASVNTYDLQGNILEVQTKTLDGRIEKTVNTYTYTNKIATCSKSFNYRGNTPVEYYEYKLYDSNNDYLGAEAVTANVGSSSTSTHKTAYYYDELGRLYCSERPISGGAAKYNYDIHGWLTDIQTNSFREQIFYECGYENQYLNGNISSIIWTNANTKSSSGYNYIYDDLNRLTSANYGEDCFRENIGDKNERISYDKNGNITELWRADRNNSDRGKEINLINTGINGNQISSIRILTGHDNNYHIVNSKPWHKIEYNTSGSLKRDDSRGITNIIYDCSNNPRRIQFKNGNVTVYVYSAKGQKLRTIHYVAVPNIKLEPGEKHILTNDEILYKDSTDYMFDGSLLLKNGKLDKYLFNGGYCQHTDNNASFYYFNQDHLGNNREVIDENGEVVQTNDFYPSGTPFYDNNTAGVQPFKYNGKELDLMHGLNTYDYGARQYYAFLPTWDRIDPLCEKYYSISPYAYCANNPVNRFDPDGRDWYQDKNKNAMYFSEDDEIDKEKWTMIGNGKDVLLRTEIDNNCCGGYYEIGLSDGSTFKLDDKYNSMSGEDILTDKNINSIVFEAERKLEKKELEQSASSINMKKINDVATGTGIITVGLQKAISFDCKAPEVRSFANATTSMLSKLGIAAGAVNVLVSGKQLYNDINSCNMSMGGTVKHGIDFGMSIIGLCGPAGATIGLCWTLSSPILTYYGVIPQ